MKISEKRFSIVQLIDNREDYVVQEVFYILGFSIYYTLYGLDGINGDIPFDLISSAVYCKQNLEEKEHKQKTKRNIIISIILVFILLLIWLICFY
jgi:accessory gene regulator protein AgrB